MVIEILFIVFLAILTIVIGYAAREIKKTEIVCCPETVHAKEVIDDVLDRIEQRKINATVDFDEKGIHIVAAGIEEFPEEEEANA